MNSKGFSLIELVVVVAILALIAITIVPNVLGLINNNKEKEYNNLVNNIKSAAKNYISDYRYNLNSIGKTIDCNSTPRITSFEITIEELTSKKYLSSPVINPINNSDMTGKVIAIFDCSKKTFTYTYNE